MTLTEFNIKYSATNESVRSLAHATYSNGYMWEDVTSGIRYASFWEDGEVFEYFCRSLVDFGDLCKLFAD